MGNIKRIILGGCIISALFLIMSGCTLEPSQETIELQEIMPVSDSELPVIDEVYHSSVRDEVYPSDEDEELTP